MFKFIMVLFRQKPTLTHTWHLLHEVVGAEEVAGPATHDEGTAVDVDQDCPPHPARQPRREHVQAAQQGEVQADSHHTCQSRQGIQANFA